MSSVTKEDQTPLLCRIGLHRWKIHGDGRLYTVAGSNRGAIVYTQKCRKCGHERPKAINV